ncbi:16S rRNA (guanine(527)-N(7))-methyltransferase RsmG [Pseudochelatococcus contaminans]|uniref:Ribosomal RNA small subunit methyltransferase G n=1 Tax=Pseudochelatococcus contaminans TaxID=1538103 RepID=A0A7W5Z709_9HYPH|nr:16S rRNA (guanine(527)-N(7))-methyltransferase RsmG [Pseudochelatococcus contaminans]MBB3811035.1 16S rRNA (guanine527-N7)-methyltransferase [Pseudochelatococcus contaminans]
MIERNDANLSHIFGLLNDVYPVSRETCDRLVALVQELHRWQKVKNLVGPSTLDDVWTRHILDSLQLFSIAPEAQRWVDMGSGAGFPGLVIGLLLAERGEGNIHLIESNGRKCAFQRHAIRVTGARAIVHDKRIESVVPALLNENIEVVTARALAPLTDLLDLSKDLLRNGAIGVFPKGQDWESELTKVPKSWKLTLDHYPSKIESRSRILVVREFHEGDTDHE